MPRLNARLLLRALEERVTPDATPHNLAVSNFYQNWNNASLISSDDDWSGVLSIAGFSGEDTFGEGIDPQTILTPYSTIDVAANQGSNTDLTVGGVAEFDGLTNPVIALQADGTADAPNLVVSINTTGRANISISYTLRDLDETTDSANQSVALHYRIGNAGNFVNVPAGFVADATTGPNLATKVTSVSVTLPSAVDNQALVQVRVITTNAVGNDEWVGVEDIVVGTREFAINTFTTGSQFRSSMAVDADGDAFVTWESSNQDGSGYGIYGQRFNAAGMKVGVEFQVNTYTISHQRYSSVAVDADGDSFVTWVSHDGSGYGIYGQRFNAAGMKVGVEIQVNTTTTADQNYASVAMDDDGDAFVVWTSAVQDGSGRGIFGQRFDAAGMKVGGEIQVNTFTTETQWLPSVAMDADGDAFVTWSGNGQSDFFGGVYGQRFNSAGMKVGGEFQINTYTTGQQEVPSVAVDADGDAIVVWNSFGQDGNDFGVYGQRFDAAGMKVGVEFQVNTSTTAGQASASVAVDADGDAFVVWHSNGQDGNGYGIYGQRFNAAGMKVGGEFHVNTYTTGDQVYPSVAVDSDGDAMVVWYGSGQNGSGYGVYGQRFWSPNPLAKVASIQVNDGSAQRGRVTSVSVTFDQQVSFMAAPSAVFQLHRQSDNQTIMLSAVVNGNTVTLSFTGGPLNFGSLADGRYTLTIDASQVSNAYGLLDGDGNGIAGDNFVHVGGPSNGPRLFRLFGDFDGDGTIAANDFIQFRLPLGGSPSPAFDFYNDNSIDASDFIQFRLRFGGSV